MPYRDLLLPEWQQEAAATRKTLAAVPFSDPQWKPHEKSMTIARLAAHIVEMCDWVGITLEMNELDFAKYDHKPFVPGSVEELLKEFDVRNEKAIQVLAHVSDETLQEIWTMRRGEQVFFSMPKMNVLRTFTFSHLIHHRAQLGVYLRLLNIPVPGSYGPTADEK